MRSHATALASRLSISGAPRAVGAAGPDDGQLKAAGLVGAAKDLFTGEFVAPVFADGFLRERFIDQNLWRYLDAVGADGGAEDELLATSAKRADGAGRLFGSEADHINDHVETCRQHGLLELIELIAVAPESFHLVRQCVLTLGAVEDGDLRAARKSRCLTIPRLIRPVPPMMRTCIAQTRSQASAGIQCASLPSHLTLQPMGLVRGLDTDLPASCSRRAFSRSLTVILLVSRGLSTPRPV